MVAFVVNKYQIADPNEELMQCTKKLLKILTMGQLIPPPLSHLHVIIEHFEPPEVSRAIPEPSIRCNVIICWNWFSRWSAFQIALLLKECIWNYLKDHVPSPALFHVDSNGLQWRNPQLNKVPVQYVDTLRNLMQKKLAKLGQHYYEMFIMPEQHQHQQQQQKPSLLPSSMVTASGIPMGIASCIPGNNSRSTFSNQGSLTPADSASSSPDDGIDGSTESMLIIDDDVTIIS